MPHSLLRLCVTGLVLIAAIEARGDVTLFSDRTAYLAAFPPSQVAAFDFETSSGFPASDAGAASYVGNVGGVTFVGVTNGTLAPPGTQVFSGLDIGFSCCFGVAAIDFTSLPQQPYAIGFSGGDLTVDEIIRVIVGFDDGSASSYSVSLGGEAPFTPIFFGLVDSSRTVRFMQLFGADAATPDSATRAWWIDDLTIAAVPEPGTWAMLGAGLLMLLALSRRRAGRA